MLKFLSTQVRQLRLGNDYSQHERLRKLRLLLLQYRREINDLIFFF